MVEPNYNPSEIKYEYISNEKDSKIHIDSK